MQHDNTQHTMAQTSKEKELKRQKRMSEDPEYAEKRRLQKEKGYRKRNKTPERILSEHKRYLARRHPVASVSEDIQRPDMASFTPKPTPAQLLLQSYWATSATNKPGADSIDGCAAMLASVDKRSYSRALLRDADAILEKVTFPMSFPWTHRLETQSRIIPHDIDELPGVRAAVAVDQLKGASEDTTLSQSTLSRKVLMPPLKRDDSEDDDVNIPGELSFRMFLEVQGRKRQRIELELVDKETKMVSTSIGSPIPTHLPHHVRYGRKMSSSVAKDFLQ
jgi:hypothetical protein